MKINPQNSNEKEKDEYKSRVTKELYESLDSEEAHPKISQTSLERMNGPIGDDVEIVKKKVKNVGRALNKSK